MGACARLTPAQHSLKHTHREAGVSRWTGTIRLWLRCSSYPRRLDRGDGQSLSFPRLHHLLKEMEKWNEIDSNPGDGMVRGPATMAVAGPTTNVHLPWPLTLSACQIDLSEIFSGMAIETISHHCCVSPCRVAGNLLGGGGFHHTARSNGNR